MAEQPLDPRLGQVRALEVALREAIAERDEARDQLTNLVRAFDDIDLGCLSPVGDVGYKKACQKCPNCIAVIMLDANYRED